MFHPEGHPMERGWVGRIDGGRVVHLAAQTLQSFFTGGGSAREHAEYALQEVQLLAPVLHPPSVRVFDEQDFFWFANPAAIVAPGAEVSSAAQEGPSNRLLQGGLTLVPRLAGVIGAAGALAGYTAFAEWRDPRREPPKDRDFALGLGPAVVTVDEVDPDRLVAFVRCSGKERLGDAVTGFDWAAAVDLAAAGTSLKAGDLVAGPAFGLVDGIAAGTPVELDVHGLGTLEFRVGEG